MSELARHPKWDSFFLIDDALRSGNVRAPLAGGLSVMLHQARTGQEQIRTTSDIDVIRRLDFVSKSHYRVDQTLTDLGFSLKKGSPIGDYRWEHPVHGPVDVLTENKTFLGRLSQKWWMAAGTRSALDRHIESYSVDYGGQQKQIESVTPAGLLIMKSHANRNKDIMDVPILVEAGVRDGDLLANCSNRDARKIKEIMFLAISSLGSPRRYRVSEESVRSLKAAYDSLNSRPLPPIRSPKTSHRPGLCNKPTKSGQRCKNKAGTCPHH